MDLIERACAGLAGRIRRSAANVAASVGCAFLAAAFASFLSLLAFSPRVSASAADNTVTAAIGSPVTTLDPYASVDAMTRNVVKSIFEGLVVFNEKLEVVPQLAQSWRISEDGLTYEFKLCEGVRFHDGTLLTAEAVKANFERMLEPNNALKRRTVFDFIERVETDNDPYVVRFVLKAPTSSFLARLATGTAGIICPSALKKWSRSRPESLACGTGP